MMTFDELLADMVDVNCNTCQGHSLPGAKKGHPGHCSACEGRAYVQKSRYEIISDAERVKVLEAEVMRLRPELAEKYGRKPR